MIRVLIVDDSSTMRMILTTVLGKEPDIEVVGSAADAHEARRAIKELNPDVITLDIEMPGMSGLQFLSRLMSLRPTPVVMVSTLTEKGSADTVEALGLGAFDCIVKPNAENPNSFSLLAGKIRSAHAARSRLTSANAAARPKDNVSAVPAADYAPMNVVVAIGSSTGGVEALLEVISALPANCSPVVITQHMPPKFTQALAARLDRSSAPTVVEAQNGMLLQSGHVYVAPGGEQHLELEAGRCKLRDGAPVNGHRPSVDVLFSSVAASFGRRSVGVILTGMGEDGARGLLQMKNFGAYTLGQDEASSIVYGMPKAAHKLGAVCRQLRLSEIGGAIVELTNSKGDRKNAIRQTA